MSRRGLVLLGVAALVAFAADVSIVWGYGNEWGPVDVPLILAKQATLASFLVVGLVATWRRPRSRIGLLMMAVGFLTPHPQGRHRRRRLTIVGTA